MSVKHVFSKGVTLYTAGTPNGWKASILLRELAIPHEVRAISLPKNEQKEEWFLKLNPNGRIPVIVDHDNDDFVVFESGAILMYLAERAGRFLPKDFNRKYEVIQWLMFQMGGVGPMQGQAHHFLRYASEDIEYGKKRYCQETKRLYGVLDKALAEREYLAGDDACEDAYTIADIATYPWIAIAPWAGVDMDDFPNLKAWGDRIQARPAVQQGLEVPEPSKIREVLADPEKLRAYIEESRQWIQSRH